MNSFCKHLNVFPWDAGPKEKSGLHLMIAEPSGAVLRYQKRQYLNMQTRWKNHVDGWLNSFLNERDKIIYVKYEDLNDKFTDTMHKIATRLGLKLETPVRPEKFDMTEKMIERQNAKESIDL